MNWIELRGMWDKNLLKLDAKKSPKQKASCKKPTPRH